MDKKDEFSKIWIKCGGFIPQNIAAEILDIEPPQVNRLVKSGKLKAYKEKYPYLNEVMNYETKPNMKRKKEENDIQESKVDTDRK